MFASLFKKRILLLILIGFLLLALTACQRGDNGVGPSVSSTNESGQVELFKPLASLAPNPVGPNLALTATASADSSFFWLMPSLANDGNPSSTWRSKVGYVTHWLRLDWAFPVTIGHLYIRSGSFFDNIVQTISSIKYLDLNSNLWVTIPGSHFIYGRHSPALVGYIDFYFPPVTTRAITVFLNSNPPGGDAYYDGSQSGSVNIGEIEAYGASASPKISKIEFSGSALNKIYDRKNHKLLGPPHWLATVQSGQVTETQNSSFSYVINSPLSLKPEFVSEDGTPLPSGFNFDIELTGKVKDLIGAEPERTITFPVKAWPGLTNELVSNEVLQNKVGIWGLELNWVFKKNGTQIGEQRTPKANTNHCVLTTWRKPLIDGKFKVGVPTVGGKFYAESLPTEYLEIMAFSCQFLHGFDSAKTIDEIMTTNLNKTYTILGGQGYKYCIKANKDSPRRGIDRLLSDDFKDGWCMEWSHLLKALNEVQGVDVTNVNGQLKKEYLDNIGDSLIAKGFNYTAVGGVHSSDLLPLTNPPNEWWPFKNHNYVMSWDEKSFDPTFGIIDPNFFRYFENVFDFYNDTTEKIDSNALTYIDFYFID